MSKVPDHWSEYRLGDVLTFINGRAYSQHEMLNEGTPILRIQNLNGGTNWYYSNLILPEEKYCRQGDLLYAWSATFGPYWWKGPRAIFHYHIWNVIPSDAIDKGFAYYLLMRITEDIKRAAHGVAMPHITKKSMEDWRVLLPPLDEQKRIADKLDVLLARVDACRARLDRVPAVLKRLRQAVLAAAVSGRLTEEWREKDNKEYNWRDIDIQSVAVVGTGSTPLRSNSQFYTASGTPWVTSAATSSPFINSAQEYVTPLAVAAHRLKLYPQGTLLVAMYGEGKTRGQVAELAIEATINQACAAIVVNESIALRRYVKFALQANYLEMRDMAEGGNQPNLNLSKVKEFRLLLPSLDEQHEIIRRVETLFASADLLGARYVQAREQVEQLTPALLAKAFRGELVSEGMHLSPEGSINSLTIADRIEALAD